MKGARRNTKVNWPSWSPRLGMNVCFNLTFVVTCTYPSTTSLSTWRKWRVVKSNRYMSVCKHSIKRRESSLSVSSIHPQESNQLPLHLSSCASSSSSSHSSISSAESSSIFAPPANNTRDSGAGSGYTAALIFMLSTSAILSCRLMRTPTKSSISNLSRSSS
jgi:hypothetical protein